MLKKVTWRFTALQSWSTPENFAVSQEFLKHLLQTQLEFSTSLPISFILLEHQQLSNKKKPHASEAWGTRSLGAKTLSVIGQWFNFILPLGVLSQQISCTTSSWSWGKKRHFDAWDSVANLCGCWIILDTLWGVTLDP